MIQLFQDGSGLVVDLPRRKQRALAGTWNAHLNNMVKGVTDGFTYNLKAFYSHFPMTLAVNGNTFQVNNYFEDAFHERRTSSTTSTSKCPTRLRSPFPESTRKRLAKPQPTSNAARP